MSDDPTTVLTDQVAAWNRGDLEAFCAACAADVTYVNGAGLHAGRDAVLAAYRAAYPDRAAMGTLALRVLRVEQAGPLAVVVVAWSLAAAEARAGQALLVLRREGGGWELAYDATVR